MAQVTLPISAVIPTYGRADYLLAAIDSLASANAVPREIIVIDDGSPDDTAARLAPLIAADRIRYRRQTNAGMAVARNAGAALATSEYLYFLDDDDLAFSDSLPMLLAELEQHPDAAIACGEMVIFSGEPPATPATSSETREVSRAAFLRFNPVGSPGQVLIRRSAFDEVGGFHRDFPSTEDWELWLRLVEGHRARWVSCAVMAYRLHGSNASRDVARMNNSSMRVARKHVARVPAADRTLARYRTYRALREYHAPRLRAMLREAATRAEWASVGAAGREWVASNAADVLATFCLKAKLAAQGRWRLREHELTI